MLGKILSVAGLTMGILFLSFSSAFGISLSKGKDTLVIENPYYKATISPEGARIISLILKKS